MPSGVWRGPLPGAGEIAPAVEAFGRDGVTSFRAHETTRLVRAIADRMAAREGAFLGAPVVNIGSRQTGRARSANICDVGHDAASILDAARSQTGHGRYPRTHYTGTDMQAKRLPTRV